MIKIIRAFKTKIYPTKKQRIYFNKCFGIRRFAWNWGLENWNLYNSKNKLDKAWNYNQDFIKNKPYLYQVNSMIKNMAFKNLEEAFKKYYKKEANYELSHSKRHGGFVMKKLFIGALIALSTVSFIACGNTTQSASQPIINEEAPEESSAQQEYDINMADFVVNAQLQAPDSIGNVYYEGTVTNNSPYAIKNITFVYNYTNSEGNKDTTYLSFYDTILSGETSAINECLGSDDMELTGVQVTIVDNGEDHYFEYDAKLGTIEQWY